MIEKLNSQQLNEVFETANQQVKNINDKFETAKKDLETKIKIINYETEYLASFFSNLQKGNILSTEEYIPLNKINGFYHMNYGNCVHAKTIKQPINVFNLKMSGLGESFFREDVQVRINSEVRPLYTSILKDESIKDKDIYFEIYNNNIINLSIEIINPDALLGSTRFNVLEISPFLPGSFDIEYINILSYNSYGEINQSSDSYMKENIRKVGKTRFLFDKKLTPYRIDMKIKLNYKTERNNETVYPFGLKHIYLYEMDFNTESYIIAEIKKEKNISFIKNEITIITPFEKINTTILDKKIELYLKNIDGDLSYQIEPSISSEIKEIPINTNIIYAKIPLNPTDCYESIKFEVIERVDNQT